MPYRKVSYAEQAFYLLQYRTTDLMREMRKMAKKKGGKCGK